MRTCYHCKAVMNDEEHRWEISEEWQRCIQTAKSPEVDISISYVLGEYSSEDDAMEFIESYLSRHKAKPTWADVSPVETCACCGKSFSTAGRHLTLTMIELSGPDEAPNIHDAYYVARFCRSCVPPDESATKRLDSMRPAAPP
jgi:hypothetical protein